MSSLVGHSRPKIVMLPSPHGGRDILRLSPGMDRFVGRYPLIPEFARAGGLLDIRDAD